jgi:hypothetical protein
MLINNTSDLVQNIKDRKYHSVVITTHHKPDGELVRRDTAQIVNLQTTGNTNKE